MRFAIRLALPAAALLLGLSGTSHAQQVLTSTIQPAGPRSGSNNSNFFNVEGSANGNNASYGIVRFNVGDIKSGLDAQLGAGTYSLTGITLEMTESNAAFSKTGGLGFAFTNEDTTDIKTSASPYKFPTPAPVQQDITTGTYTPISTGTVDTFNLFNTTPGGLALQNDVLNDTWTTLVINPLDATVAATYRGQNPSQTLASPRLLITATNQAGLQGTVSVGYGAIPEPATLSLLLVGLPALIRRRKAR